MANTSFAKLAHLKILNYCEIYAPEYLGIRNILIAGDRILAITEEDIQISGIENIETIDCSGLKIIPGLIDCHTHITGGGGESGFSSQIDKVSIDEFVNYGVTTVVGLLGTDDITRSTENLVSRVYGLREMGLSAFCWTGGYHYPLTTLTGQAKKDMVFLEPVIGIGEFALSDHRSSQPTYDEMIRLASEAHVAGLITGKAGVIHFHMGDGDRKFELIKKALAESEIPARVFHPTHINRNKALFEQSTELLRSGCYVDITAFPKGTADPGIEADDAILQFIDKGLSLSQVTLSSDGGGCLPQFDEQGNMIKMDVGSSSTLMETLTSLVSKGIDLQTVLPLMTSNVATLLRLQGKGFIAENGDADMVILDELYNIKGVIGGGQWFVREDKLV